MNLYNITKVVGSFLWRKKKKNNSTREKIFKYSNNVTDLNEEFDKDRKKSRHIFRVKRIKKYRGN